MEVDDPWDWSVDRVVQEFCTERRTWEPRSASTRMPDPIFLENAFRDSEISGDILLLDVDDKTMREDLMISKLGWRSTIRYGIDQLRSRSPKYHNWLSQQNHPAGPVSEHNRSIQNFPLHTDLNLATNASIPANVAHLPDPALITPGDSGNPNSPNLHPLQSLDIAQNDNTVAGLIEHLDDSHAPENKRRKVGGDDHTEQDQIVEGIHGTPVVLDEPSDTPSLTSPAEAEAENQGKKRKRFAPTLVTTVIDPSRDRTIPSEADNIHLYRLPNALEVKDSADHKNETSRAVGYLGQSELSADDVFYQDTAVGENISHSGMTVEFQERSNISSGRRLYVHGLMKHFLRARPELFKRDQKVMAALRPYPIRLVPEYHKPSFTLYQRDQDNIIQVSREDLSSWPEINPETRILNSAKSTSLTTYNVIADIERDPRPNSYKTSEKLKKYDTYGDDDDLLPAYGASEYDSEELDILEELAEQVEAEEKSKKKKVHLTSEEVNSILDSEITELVLDWQATKLPRHQRKAWKLWYDCNRRGTIRQSIREAQEELVRVEKRLKKFREGICVSKWTKDRDIRQLVSSLEATIFDREVHKHNISVLENRSPPPKTLKETIPKMKAKVVTHGNDSESGESVVSSDTSDTEMAEDNMDDFIVEELDLADDEDDVTMSDIELPQPPQTPSTATANHLSGSSIRHSSSRSTHSDNTKHHDERISHPGSDDDGGLTSPIPFERPLIPAKNELTLPSTPRHPTGKSNSAILISSDEGTPSSSKPRIRLINRNSPIIITSSSEKEQAPRPGSRESPRFDTPATIAAMGYKHWENQLDRTRLIISVVYRLSNISQMILFDFIASLDRKGLRDNMVECISQSGKVKGLDEDNTTASKTVVRLFWIFIDCKFHPEDKDWIVDVWASIGNSWHLFPEFYTLACGLEISFNKAPLAPVPKIRLTHKGTRPSSDHTAPASDDDSDDEEPRSAIRRKPRDTISSSNEDSPGPETPSKKRKKIFEDANARDLREQDRERVVEQEKRRKLLRERLSKSYHLGNVDLNRHIINDAKTDDQGYIYINQEIGKRIKPHQLDGVRFMWNQVTAGNATQGCLLAHTMGLGKTMQAITLLVAIAEAASSAERNIASQVPESLRVSKTIIICPPGLIDNWMDELLTWAPEELLGDLLKIDSSVKPLTRLQTIEQWFHNGGILIIGYEMFRDFVQGGKRGTLEEQARDRAKTQLLEGPNIIIADEAHRLKNATAGITMAANKFRSSTRLALTGSPLANNVEEYHTMIEWVAPNYLGPVTEFRQKYKEPIEQGLYFDSTPAEKRKSLKILKVLNEDLSPKVNRADMSVLRNDLPPKVEFTIMCSLTELQEKAYTIYVRAMSMLKNIPRTKTGHIKSTTMWSYLAILSLLCNHPYCFKLKLEERTREAHQNPGPLAIEDQIPASRDDSDFLEDDIPNTWKAGATEDLISQEMGLFKNVPGDLRSIELSNKVKILCQILDASRAVGDKVLVFSQTIPTLDFLEEMCKSQGRKYFRLDGKTVMSRRQGLTKTFNSDDTELFIISTTAGGLGLNLPGANRVVVFDFRYNPIHEEQAIGRAYRIGQTKKVFVYRLLAAGTYESSVHNKTVFKTQLASRVVDKKTPVAWAQKGLGEFLFEPKETKQEDLAEFHGLDPEVLDKVLYFDSAQSSIRAIIKSDIFEKNDNDHLTQEEEEEVSTMIEDERLKRLDPKAYRAMLAERDQKMAEHRQKREEDAQKHQEAFRVQQQKAYQERLKAQADSATRNNQPDLRPQRTTTATDTTPVPSSRGTGIKVPIPDAFKPLSQRLVHSLKTIAERENIFTTEQERRNKVFSVLSQIWDVIRTKLLEDLTKDRAFRAADMSINADTSIARQLLLGQLNPERFTYDALRVATAKRKAADSMKSPTHSAIIRDNAPSGDNMNSTDDSTIVHNNVPYGQTVENHDLPGQDMSTPPVEELVQPTQNIDTEPAETSLQPTQNMDTGPAETSLQQSHELNTGSKASSDILPLNKAVAPSLGNKEQPSSSQSSADDILMSGQDDTPKKVTQFLDEPTALVQDSLDHGVKQKLDNRPETPTDGNVKVDNSESSAPPAIASTKFSSSDDSAMFKAMSKRPTSLRDPVIPPKLRKKKRHHNGHAAPALASSAIQRSPRKPGQPTWANNVIGERQSQILRQQQQERDRRVSHNRSIQGGSPQRASSRPPRKTQ